MAEQTQTFVCNQSIFNDITDNIRAFIQLLHGQMLQIKAAWRHMHWPVFNLNVRELPFHVLCKRAERIKQTPFIVCKNTN